jgi:hypothetical protein
MNHMALASISEGHLELNGLGYFRANSFEIDLCDYGTKKTPLAAFNFMQVFRTLPFAKCKVEKTENIQINSSSTRASDLALDADFQVVGVQGKLGAKRVLELVTKEELVLTLVSLSVGDIVNAVNRSPSDLQELIRIGDDARIVNQVVLVTTAALSQALQSSTDISLSMERGEAKLSFNGRGSASQSSDTVIPRGATLAYMLLRPEWDAVLPKRRTRVLDGSFDQHSRIDP